MIHHEAISPDTIQSLGSNTRVTQSMDQPNQPNQPNQLTDQSVESLTKSHLYTLFHPDSEVSRVFVKVDEKLVKVFTDPYLLFLHLVEFFDIKIPEKVLDERIRIFFFIHGVKVENFEKVDKIKLLIFGERYKKVLPIGRPWEKTHKLEADTRFLPTSNYLKEFIDKAYTKIILAKEVYELRNPKLNDASYIIKSQSLPQPINIKLDSYNWAFKFSDMHAGPIRNAFTNREVEIRFQNISGLEFGRIFDFFMMNSCVCLGKSKDVNFYFHNIVSEITLYTNNVRESLFLLEPKEISKPFFQQKSKNIVDSVYKNNLWQFNVIKSEEILFDAQLVNTNNKYMKNGSRIKNTFRFYTPDKLNEFFNLEVSLSIVIETLNGRRPFRKFEVEIERKFGNERYWKQQARNPILIEKAIRKIILLRHGGLPLTKTEIDNINYKLKNILGYNAENPTIALASKVFPFSQNYVIDWVSSEYFISLKIDGERKLIYSNGRLGTFLLSLDGSVERIGGIFSGEFEVLIDCEKMGTKLYIFDVLYMLQIPNIKQKLFNDRYKHLDTIIFTLRKVIYETFSCTLKKFESFSFKTLISFITTVSKDKQYDGIIFQPNTIYNKGPNILKWKHKFMNTVDLLLNEKDQPITLDQKLINLPVKVDYNLLPYTKHFSLHNFVLECWYNPILNCFQPIKFRFEKTNPNNIAVVYDTQKLITNHFTIKHFQGYQLTMARKLINELKRRLLDKNGPYSYSKGGTLLDIGSGQGGDIDKWSHFDKVIAVELDETQCDRFLKRLGEKPSSVQHKIILKQLVFDEKNVDSILNNSFVNLVTVFFAVNKIFKNDKSLTTFVNALVKTSSPVLMLFHDGKDFIKKVKVESLRPESKGVVEIKEYTDNLIETTVIGTDYVQNVSEYLFYTDLFIKTAEPYFSIQLLTFQDMMPLKFLSNLSKIEQKWLESIRFLHLKPLDKNEEEETEYLFDEHENIQADTLNAIAEDDEPDILEYARQELYEDSVTNEEDIENMYDEKEKEEEDIVEIKDWIDFPSDLIVSLVTESSRSDLSEVSKSFSENGMEVYYQTCKTALKRSYLEEVWNIKEYSWAVFEYINKYELSDVRSVFSNLPRETFIVENLTTSLVYETNPLFYEVSMENNSLRMLSKTGLESLLMFDFLKSTRDEVNVYKFLEWGDSIAYFLKIEEIEGFINNMTSDDLKNQITLYFCITTPCLILIKNKNIGSNVTVFDIQCEIITLFHKFLKYIDGFHIHDCLRIIKKKVNYNKQKVFYNLVLRPVKNGISWKNNSCYADSVLMCMAASNMVKTYLYRLKTCSKKICVVLLRILEYIYCDKQIESKEIIKELGLKCGRFEDAVEFYRTLCEHIPEFNYTVRTNTNTNMNLSIVLKSEMEHNIAHTSSQNCNMIILENDTCDTLGKLYNIVVKGNFNENCNTLIKSKPIKESFGLFQLQGCLYLIPEEQHYICTYKKYNKWYQYDGLQEPCISPSSSYKCDKDDAVPYLLFYLKVKQKLK